MTAEPQLFRINPQNRESKKITEVEFSQLGFQERRDIQEWIAANPGILGEDLLIIGKEFSGFDRTNERLDLLAVDVDGKLVIIELKRDHTGADAHWQAIKYASYIHRARREDIIRMFASYANISESEAVNQLLRHLGADDLNGLNNDQRIILASHRFAPEVTSASLWLNEKTDDENLITCVQLIPYHDVGDDSLYIQANTIIPMPGVEEYSIGIGDSKESEGYQSDFGIKLRRTFQRNRDDEVTEFLRKVASMTSVGLPEEIKPDMNSRWGAGSPNYRYYRLWYSRAPWSSTGRSMWYAIVIRPEDDGDGSTWRGDVRFEYRIPRLGEMGYSEEDFANLEKAVQDLDIYPNLQNFSGGQERRSIAELNDQYSLDDNFAKTISNALRILVQEITPVIDEFEDERTNQESVP